ncbi:MAG TPA: glucosaminidase domain-containing protein, partial [Chitinophagaceae bacterium]
MKKLVFLFVASIVLVVSSFSQSSEVIRNYIETYKDIAILEMIRTGVPASIKLAQGIHETGAGQSALASKSNNHFGIKCKSEWKGPSVSHDDDARGECFRKYESPFESYRDHSDFLSTRSHYASLFKLDPTDYEAWAYGLKKAGYATNPKYPQILIKIIRDYNLQEYTLIALGKKGNDGEPSWVSQDNDPAVDVAPPQIEKPKKVYPSGIFKINETNVVFVPKGTAYLAIAQLYNVSLSRLFDFNELTGMEETMYDQLIFLQRKRKQGATEFHIVEEGESL